MKTYFTRTLYRTKHFAASIVLTCCAATATAALPDAISNTLKKADIKESEISIAIFDAHPQGKTWLLHNDKTVMYPASVIKLVTTYAALDILGPDYTWKTAVFTDGTLSQDGHLYGSLYIRGSGDPSMTSDRMRELLLQVRAAGIKTIEGNLMIDQSAYDILEVNPGAFDGEPLRPYNVRPDTLLVNFKTISFLFNPSMAKEGDKIPVIVNPPLTGLKWTPEITVNNLRSCGDWQASLKADFSDPLNIQFKGSIPISCGLKQWYIAYPEPKSHALRAVGGLWQELGGDVKGIVSFSAVPSTARLIASADSKTLAEVVRDVNKYSNNVMAQSVFLALSLPNQKAILSAAPLTTPATLEGSRKVLTQWWRTNFPNLTPPVMDNGSGLSRTEAISAQALAALLQHAWAGRTMPEFMGSLPIASIDGTMRRSRATASAHIKTGTMRNIMTRAGYVLGPRGERRILVVIINSPKAHNGREVMDALIDWAAEQ